MKKIAILFAALLLCGNGIAFGQGATTAEKLALSRRLSEEFNRKKAEAVRVALEKGWPVRTEYPNGRIMEIMEIGPNGFPEYEVTNNINAARTTNTDDLWPGGSSGLNLTGNGFTIGEWDGGGVRTTHVEFRVGGGASRVTQMDGPVPTSYHSTHVAGTMIAEGDDANAHGMASQANLDAYEWNNDVAEMLNANAVDNIILSNHSYGRVRGWDYDDNTGYWWWFGDTTISGIEDYQFGFYGQLAKTWDSMAYVMPDYLIVKSAGNDNNDDHTGWHYVYNPSTGGGTYSSSYRDPDGGADGYDCLENRSLCKNLLTVGACNDIPAGWTQASDVVITDFSSWGPTDDGRIKPDIVANGDHLYSSSDFANNAYETLSGTSMSSPNVTGTLAALQQYYYTLNNNSYMMADELKALVINTANEAGTNSGPDYKFGWGLLNATGMAELIHLDDSLGNLIRRTTLANGTTDEFIYYSDGNSPINVTLCWIDPAHTALAPALNPTTICLEHDLDLRIINPGGGTVYPWKLNPTSPSNAATRNDNYRDNVEKVTIDNPSAGQYTIRITHKGTITTQYYAFVVSGLQTQRFTNTWTAGGTTDYWYINGNWSLGHDPVDVENAVIPSGSSFHAIVDMADGVCYSLNVGSDVWLEIRDDSLTIDQDLLMYGLLEIDNDLGRLIIGDDAYWYSGSSADIQAANTQIWVYGDWRFYSGTNVNITHGMVDFAGTGISYIYTYDSDAAFYRFGDYKTGGGYVEHISASTQPLRTNDYFYLHFNSEFRSTTSQSIIIKGYFSKASSATCNLLNGTIVMDGSASSINFDPPGNFYNLTISPSTSISLQDDIDVNGDLLIEQGTLIAGTHKIHVAGDWQNTVGDAGFNEAGSRVIFDQSDGPSSYILSGENFDTLDVSIFDQVIMEGLTTAEVTCDHYNWTGGTVYVLNSTFTIDDLVQDGIYGYWIAQVNGVINIHQDVGHYIDLHGNVSVLGGSMYIFGGGDNSYWGFAPGTSVTISSGTLDFVNWGIKVWNDYPFTENITGGTIKTAGVFNIYRSDYNPTGGTIEFRSSADGYISNNAGSNFYNILINKFSKGASSPGEKSFIPDDRLVRNQPGESRKKRPPAERGNIVILQSNVDINGNLTISNGILDVSASNYSINIAGDWTNNVDLTGFNERSGLVTFDGASGKDITTSETFYNLTLNKTYASTNGLEIFSGNLIKVNNNLNVNDGTIEINPNSILDISGNLTISLNAGINADDNPTTVRIGGNWTDNNVTISTTAGFNPGYNSMVLFYGTADQTFSTAATAGILNNLTLDKGASSFRSNDNLDLRGDMLLQTGSWSDNVGSLVHSFRGDFTVNSGANFYGATGNTCKFIGGSDQVIIFDPVLSGGYFYDVVVDKSIAKGNLPDGRENKANLVSLGSDIIALTSGNLTVNYGTLDLNGNYFRAAGDVKIYSGGKISVDDDAWLEVGGGDSLIVFSGGTLEVVGSDGHEAKVIGHNDLYHAFEVRSGGTISANHAIFEETGSAGLYVQSGGLINTTNDFDYCTFQNGQAAAAALLRIDNNQTITVDSAYFPTSTTTKNVSKTLNQGDVTFVGATGAFAGPAYEDDANGRIQWAENGRWDGSASTNWNTPGNWYFDLVPTSLVDVVIPAGCPNYPVLAGSLGVNTSAYTYDCKSLDVNTGGKLTSTGSYDIYNSGSITVNGDLDIGDDYTGNAGSVLNIEADTTKFGNGTSSSIFTLNSGAIVNQGEGHLLAEAYSLASGSQFNGNGGMAHLSLLGSAPATQTIIINDADSYFYHFQVDAGVNASLSTSSQDLDIQWALIVDGTLNPFGKTITAFAMDVYGTLAIDSGLVAVLDNGPYFHNLGTLNMTGGTIDAGNTVRWYSGSGGTVTGGEIYAENNWDFENGSNIHLGAGNTVFFEENFATSIKCKDSDASFGTVDLNKPVSTSSDIYIDGASTYPMLVAGNLYLRNGNQFHLQGEDLTVQGELVNEAGSELDMANGADFINNLDFTLNGSLAKTGGNVLIHGNFQEAADGIITLNGGSFICDHAYAPRAIYFIYGDFNMSSGTFEITNNHFFFHPSATENITGGTIRVGGSFIATSPNFTPSGGTVEMINASGGGYPYVDLHETNYLQNLTISGTNTWLISGSGASELHILKDLTINAGCLNGSDDTLYVGDDWINNAGNTGFTCGTGIVYLNGASPTPEVQQVMGTTTFYDLSNINTVAVARIDGPVTVNHVYASAAGGAACQTLVVGSPFNIVGQLIVNQGAFALSSSAPAVTAGTLVQGGSIQLTNGSFTANELVADGLYGTYTLYNGTISLTQDAASFFDLYANLYIYGGIFNLIGGSDVSYWPGSGSHVLEMSAGILDFQDVGIRMVNNNMTYTITGGKIKTAWHITAEVGCSVFDPTGGSVEMYDNVYANVSLGTGSWFHDLIINKPGYNVYALRNFPVKHLLDVKAGTFSTNGYTVNVGP
jgi:hypothetical protein